MKKLLFILFSAVLACGSSYRSNAQLIISTIGGTGTAAYSGDHGPATAAGINTPYGVAVSPAGTVYFTDYGNHRIRKIDTFGTITTIAGTGVSGFTGDGGPATAAKLSYPRGIALDGAGNVYFSDYSNNRIRKISTSGIITTVAGNSVAAFAGDGGPASAASLNFPWGVTVDGTGNIYIADQFNCRIRKVNPTGIISTICGNGICFSGGDGGPASAAILQYPVGVACDGAGNLYIADYGNNRVRMINTSGIISTIAGSPTYGFTGDGGPSTAARLYYPMGIAADPAGNVYICDVNNNRVRMINTSGVINTIIGNGTAGYSGDGANPVLSEINRPTGVAVDALGRVYISDNNNSRIRKVHVLTHSPFFTHGHVQDIVTCPTDYMDLDSLLAVYDMDTGQTEIWSLISGPSHGLASIADTMISTGSTLYPTGTAYSPTGGYYGIDSFKVRITDGGLSDTTTIRVTILPPPFAGTITGADSLCPGDTLTYIDTAAGGTWSTSSTAIATVSSSGQVSAVSYGAVTLSYTVTNTCGTAYVTFPVIIKPGCPVGINTLTANKGGSITVFPNPSPGNMTITLFSYLQEDVHFVVTNIVGEKIKEFTAPTNKPVDITINGPLGVYFISGRTIHGSRVTKLMLEK